MQRKRFCRSSAIVGCLLLLSSLVTSCTTAPPGSGPQRTLEEWQTRLERAYFEERDQAKYVAALTAIARQWPVQLQQFDPTVVYRAFGRSWKPPAQPAALRDLYASLYAANWKLYGVQPINQEEYIRLLADIGDWPKAGEVARQLGSPRMALRLKVDKRFEPLVQAEPYSFDYAAVAVRQVADWEEAVRQLPRLLVVRELLAVAYLEAGQYRQALASTEDLVAASASAVKKQFDDSEKLNWIYETRARAHTYLGEWSAAEQDYLMAASLQENGRANVSNTLNLASFYARQGRGQEALRILGSLGMVSEYGSMVESSVRLKAALSTGDSAAANKALEYIRRHRNASPEILLAALLYAKQFDEAADVLIDWLADPETRGRALETMQQYPEEPKLPADALYLEHYQQLQQRAEVRAVIDKVGRIERVSFP